MHCECAVKCPPIEEFTIRRACDVDAPAISQVLNRSFQEFRSLYTTEAFSATTPKPLGVLRRLREGVTWVALVNGSIVGTISSMPRTGGLYLRGMGVLPEYRGHNIAWKLLESVEKYAKFHGYVRVYLWTAPFLEDAIGLYEKFGFICVKEEPKDFFGVPLYTMEKNICWRCFINLMHKSI